MYQLTQRTTVAKRTISSGTLASPSQCSTTHQHQRENNPETESMSYNPAIPSPTTQQQQHQPTELLPNSIHPSNHPHRPKTNRTDRH